MAKGSSLWIDQLSSLLGLDNETVKTQILPFLDSFDDQASLRTHLQGLVGTDTPLAKSFVRDFTRSRFPPSAAALGSTTPISSDPTRSPGHKKRGKKTLAERAAIGQTLAPRKLEHAGLEDEDEMAQLAEAFGGMGTVYRKKQDEEEFFAGTGKGKKAKHAGNKTGPSVEHSGIAGAPSSGRTPTLVESHHVDTIDAATLYVEEPSTTAALAKSQPSPPPTAEMLAIDAVVEELTSTLPPTFSSSNATIDDRKLCFCQGRRHALAPYAPLCYSCGLILCSAIHPSPLSPVSACPSCSASPLLSAAARSDLVAKLTSERQVLLEQQLLQIAFQREQKKLNKATARSAREEQAALFPHLGHEPSASIASSVPHSGPVMGKHGALQKAKAIASDAQRTAKVLSLNMTTHKVKTHTKVTRPKPTAEPTRNAATTSEAEKEAEQNPFIGLDGSPLVRNDADDGLRQHLGVAVGKTYSASTVRQGAKTIPPRKWVFSGRELTLVPTAPVQ